EAVDDAGDGINGYTGGPVQKDGSALNILANDELNGDDVEATEVTLKVGGTKVTTPVPFLDEDDTEVAGVVLNANGTVMVAAGTPSGTYTLDYTICEVLNPDNCSDPATITVTVVSATIEAMDDTGDDINGYTGGLVQSDGSALNILANDELNGDEVDATEAR